jgi:hypothetical protein
MVIPPRGNRNKYLNGPVFNVQKVTMRRHYTIIASETNPPFGMIQVYFLMHVGAGENAASKELLECKL